MKTVIIGGVAGGMSAATRLRRLDENAQIVVLERSGHVSFANCGLPYYIGDVIADRDALLLQTPSSLKARFGIDVRVNSEALSIDRGAKSDRLHDRRSTRLEPVRRLAVDHAVLDVWNGLSVGRRADLLQTGAVK